jgi:hypothetical protein
MSNAPRLRFTGQCSRCRTPKRPVFFPRPVHAGGTAGAGGSLARGGPAQQGLTYRQINEQTGISVTTIGRVARFLADGNGGYLAVANDWMENPHDGSGRAADQGRVQKSGRLTDNSLHLMETCGLIYSRGRDQLICFGENMPVDVLLVRDDDIPELVAEGICDLGIVGMNVFPRESGRRHGRPPGARARLRPLPAVDRGAARLRLRLGEQPGGPQDRHQLPAHPARGWRSRASAAS